MTIKYKMISDLTPKGLENTVNKFFDGLDKQGLLPIYIKSYWDSENRRFFVDILYTEKTPSVIKELMKNQIESIIKAKES